MASMDLVLLALESADDDHVNPHMNRIKNQAGDEESDEEDENFVADKDDSGSPSNDSEEEDSDASLSGGETELRPETKKKVTFQIQVMYLLASSVSESRVNNVSRMTFLLFFPYSSLRYVRWFDCFPYNYLQHPPVQICRCNQQHYQRICLFSIISPVLCNSLNISHFSLLGKFERMLHLLVRQQSYSSYHVWVHHTIYSGLRGVQNRRHGPPTSRMSSTLATKAAL